MPRIPTVDSLGPRPSPQTAKPVVPLQLGTPSRAGLIEAQAYGQLGESAASLGDSMAALNHRDQVLLDQTKAEDATSKYLNALNRFTYDPGDGFTSYRGADVVNRDLQKEYGQKRLEAVNSIEEGLTTVEQRNAFRQRVNLANREFDSKLYRHIADQTNVYHEQVYDGVLQSERSHAAANWQQPGVIENSLLRTYNAIDSEAIRKGIPSNAVSSMKEIAEAQLHTSIVEQMLVEGKDQAALAYYNGIQKRLTPESRVTLGLKVKSASVDGEALRGADSIWSAVGPKSSSDPVMIANMEDQARRQYKDDPRVANSVISQLRSMAQAHNAQQQEVTASQKASVLQAYHDGADLATLQRMPAYMAMDGTAKEDLRQYVMSRGWTEQQHARADAEWKEGEKAKRGFQKYWDLSSPTVLEGMSENQILAMEPSLGRNLVGDLMAKKRSLTTREGAIAASIDQDLFNVIASSAGLKPYAKTIAPEEKAYLGNLKNNVETKIDQAQRELKRTLTREEKEALMRSTIEQKVILDVPWSFDKKLPIGAVPRDQLTNIRVPVVDIEKNWLGEAMNYMRSKNYLTPSRGRTGFQMTDDEIKSRYKSRLEKAFAVRLSGGSQDDIDRALKGE